MAFSPAVEAFLKKNNKAEDPLDVFLRVLLRDKKKAFKFIELLMDDKLSQNDNAVAIEESFKTREDFLLWYYNYYMDFYPLWFRYKWDKGDIEDCVKMLPTITPWAFEDKSPTKDIGEIPKDFGTKEDFLNLIDKLVESQAVTDFRRIKDMEVHEPDSLLSDKQKNQKRNVDNLAEKTKVVKRLLKEQMAHDFIVEVNTKKFRIHPLFNPVSNKIVVRVQTPNRHKYIIKFSQDNIKQIQTDAMRKSHENQLIRADSPYSNAMLDFYLKLNNCPMAPQILYYNFVYDVVLYRETNATTFRFPNRKHTYKNPVDFNKNIVPAISKLGVYINDIRDSNFLQCKSPRTPQLIDAGHVTYANILNPGLPGYVMNIGNLCGKDAIIHFGALYLWKEKR